MTEIYIVRHCEAEGNTSGFFQGITDCGITERGQLQLELLKERFHNINLDVIYTSPLKRTMLTAEAVQGGRDIEIIKEPEIIEINAGDMEGKLWSELPVLYPDTYSLWESDIGAFQAPNGESTRDVYKRMKQAITRIAQDNRGKTVAVVTHGCAVYMLMSFIHGYSEEEIGKRAFWSKNTSVSLVNFDEDMKPEVVLFNDDSHISENENASARPMKWLSEGYGKTK
ncbi:MAG: histidine phosphatase family protein [Oscillospiraceae bacterium]|nr:histidine phosphatase family protein [Oscillospiraceae bacterium]